MDFENKIKSGVPSFGTPYHGFLRRSHTQGASLLKLTCPRVCSIKS